MRTFLRLFNIIFIKRRHKKLVIPFSFLIIELAVAIVLNWQLFGEKYEFSDSLRPEQASIHNPLIVIKAVHSDRLTHPYGSLVNDIPVFSFFSEKYMTKALCFLASLFCAYMGIFISMLWINRFFRNNNLNIRWWLWPTACLGAHGVLYLIANSTISNIFLKQF
jgi:hypothetical protein